MRHGYVSYAHDDHAMVMRLMVHLRPVERELGIEFWRDDTIRAGEVRRDAIAQADIFIPCISPDFFYSDFLYRVELPAILRRADEAHALVVPVILRDCAWYGSVGSWQAVPLQGQGALPINKWRPQTKGFTAAAGQIAQACRVHFGLSAPPPPRPVRRREGPINLDDLDYLGPGKLSPAAIIEGVEAVFAQRKARRDA